MIFVNKKFFFKKALILLDDEALFNVAHKNPYAYVSAISYSEYKLSNWKRKEKDTALINLRIPEEEIFTGFNDTTRNEIRKTYSNDQLSISQNEADFVELYELYSSFERAQGRKPMEEKEARRYIPFAVKYGSEIIAGQFVYASRPWLRIRSIFSKRLEVPDKEMIKVISNAGRRLMWEICRWGRMNKYESLDVASVNQSEPKSKNIALFKMSFGGKITTEYTYIYESGVYKAAARIYSLLIH
jgi:hypothetical protein